ncbi:MAG: hypothetical protein JNK15_21590 [Planctomycetes bacterium]|nr:hypothetical protein [Planctomycetota bacterium]
MDLLRQVVAKAPGRADYVFDFVEALLESVLRRGAGGPGGANGPGGPGRDRERSQADIEARLVVLREAMEHAEVLLQAQPDVADVVALAARVGSELGATLRDAASLAAGDERAARLRQAESALLAAVVLETKLVDPAGGSDPRHLLQAIGTRRELAALYLASGRRPDALQQASFVLDLLESQAAAAPVDPSAPNRRRLAALFDQRPVMGLEDLVQRLQESGLHQRWQALRQQFPRPGEPPPDRRR